MTSKFFGFCMTMARGHCTGLLPAYHAATHATPPFLIILLVRKLILSASFSRLSARFISRSSYRLARARRCTHLKKKKKLELSSKVSLGLLSFTRRVKKSPIIQQLQRNSYITSALRVSEFLFPLLTAVAWACLRASTQNDTNKK